MYESTCPFAVNGRDKVNMRGREERVTKKNNNGEDLTDYIPAATPRPYQGTCSLLTEIDSTLSHPPIVHTQALA